MQRCECLSHNGFLTERGYAEFAQRGVAPGDQLGLGLTREVQCVRVDRSGSVSGLRRDEIVMIWPTDEVTDEQFRRITEARFG